MTQVRGSSKRKRKGKKQTIQLFPLDGRVCEEHTSGRPKRRKFAAPRFNPSAGTHRNNSVCGEGFDCPECSYVCSYDSEVCDECGLACFYKDGVGAVVLKDDGRAQTKPVTNTSTRKKRTRSSTNKTNKSPRKDRAPIRTTTDIILPSESGEELSNVNNLLSGSHQSDTEEQCESAKLLKDDIKELKLGLKVAQGEVKELKKELQVNRNEVSTQKPKITALEIFMNRISEPMNFLLTKFNILSPDMSKKRKRVDNETAHDQSKSTRPKSKRIVIPRKENLFIPGQPNRPNSEPPFKVGEGFACPKCKALCSYDQTKCKQCHLECWYHQGIGVVRGRQIDKKKQDIPQVSWDDIIGNQTAKEALLDLPMCRNPNDHMLYDEEVEEDGNTGILLSGPPGTGKTLIAKAVASHANCSFTCVSPDDVLNAFIGKSEEKMREIFITAKTEAVEQENTSVLFFDECDRLFRKGGKNDCEVSSNITAIFQECMDGVQKPSGQVVVLAATNHPERLPQAILSRFQNRIEVQLPGAQERKIIIKLQIEKKTINIRSDMKEADFDRLAEATEGASGRDIETLVRNALKVRRISTTNHDGWWCKDEEGVYVPCFHSWANMCKKEKFSYNQRPDGYKARSPPLSYKHFEEAIEKYGLSPRA